MNQIKKASEAKKSLQKLTQSEVSSIIAMYADLICKNIEEIIIENQKDLAKMDKENPKHDRLLLDKARILSIAQDAKKIADFTFDPFAKISENIGQNGIKIEKKTTPFGVIGIIFESRPNVVVDAISICLKTQNVCVLKGSSEADFSNKILSNLAKIALKEHGCDENAVVMLGFEISDTLDLISARGLIDVVIPRGGAGLIEFVRENSKVPVIETGAGVVHFLIDEDFDTEIAKNTIFNAKTRRPSVCNSLDCLVVCEKSLSKLSEILTPCVDFGVEFFCDEQSFEIAKNIKNINIKKADNEHFGVEFLSLKMSIKTVKNADEGINFINSFSSKHSESIITKNQENAEKFLREIDAAAVYHNTSTAFTDGGCFGMNAEIGISTQKLHARGPFALNELLTYKYTIRSDGSVR